MPGDLVDALRARNFDFNKRTYAAGARAMHKRLTTVS
jgi:hypothetical protein